MGKAKTIARRTFLLGTAAVAGGLAIGYWRYKSPYDNPLRNGLGEDAAALTPFIRIDRSGVTVITPRAEMGQGIHTTLAAMVAEELDIGLDQVRVEHGPASPAYYNKGVLAEGLPFPTTDQGAVANGVRGFLDVPAKFMGMQITGGSTSTHDGFDRMRKAGAAARIVLRKAAARAWSVPAETLKTERGRVRAPDGREAPYSDLAVWAKDITPPRDPALKPASEWRLLGKSQPRVDVVAKSTGTATFGIDVRLPDMLYATVRRSPRLGAGLKRFDASEAERMTGVHSIVALSDGIAVIASNTWYAFEAANAVTCEWEEAAYPANTDAHFDQVAAAFDSDPDSVMRDDGDVDEDLARPGGQRISATYRAPYLAHATMEPMNATAWLKPEGLEIWAGNQFPTQAAKDGAALAGLDVSQVRVHTPYMGGGFGRRAEMDFIKTAVEVAMAVPGRPVKTTWTREEDTTHDNYRPLAEARMTARIEDGRARAFDVRLSAPSVVADQMGRYGLTIPGPDVSIVQSVWDQPYSFEHVRVSGYRAPVMLPVSSWRSVGASQNGFFHECMLDEIATEAGADPVDMRLQMLTDPTSRKVLEKAADMAGWGSPVPDGRARGVAFVLSFGVPVAEIVEIEQTEAGVRIVEVCAALDVGRALDPRNIEAQVQSAVNFGLAAAMMGEITVTNGMVDQANFDSYDSIRIHQAPSISVSILENGPKLRGVGEPGLPPAAPALGNALFALTGQRIRDLPFGKHVQFI